MEERQESKRNGQQELLTSFASASTIDTASPGAGTATCPAEGGERQRASAVLFAAVCLCCASPLLFGFAIAFTSPTQPTMEGDPQGGVLPPPGLREFTKDTEKWYASLFNVGAVLGAFSGSALSDRLGRRRTLAFTALPHAVAWAGTALSHNWIMLTALRILSGWAVGMGSAVTPCYIGEIATTGLRGALGAANQLSVTMGIFLVSLLGDYAFVVEYQGRRFSEWRELAVFGLGLSAVLLGMLCMPESPRWHAKRGDKEATKVALQRLRTGDVSAEVQSMMAESCPSSASCSASAASALSSATAGAQAGAGLGAHARSLVIGVGLCMFQQLSGVNAIMMYTTKICEEAQVPNAELSAMASMAVQVVLTAVSCVLVERAGRRPLLLVGSGFMGLAHALLACYYAARSLGLWAPSWVALLALGTFIVSFSVGMGPIPWLLLAELFPTEVRGTASSLATAVNWSSSFVVCLCFQPLQDAITPQGTFLLFAVICFACLAFVKLLVPETKGKSVEQVLSELRSGGPGAVSQTRDVTLAAR